MAKNEHFLDFEKPIADVVNRVADLKAMKEDEAQSAPIKDFDEEVDRLRIKEKTVLRRLYRALTPWQKVQVARHPNRPHAVDYIGALIDEFQLLQGDRAFADDKAMVAGIGRFMGQPVCVLGTEKGHDTKTRMRHGFGMPRPEGYRKAQRIMEMADKFGLPLLTFVDTPGAFPGVDAEARGQAEAIASCIEKLLTLRVPVVAVITGEGGSGGAIAIAVADKILMLEHSVYSVISPEGCASILWRDAKMASSAAEALKMTATDLDKLGLIDGIIKEPVGGAQRDHALTFKRVAKEIDRALKMIQSEKGDLVSARRKKFLAMRGE